MLQIQIQDEIQTPQIPPPVPVTETAPPPTGEGVQFLGLDAWIWIAILAAILVIAAVALMQRARRRAAPPEQLGAPPPEVRGPEREAIPLPVREEKPATPAAPAAPEVVAPRPRDLADGLGRTRNEGFVGRIRALVTGRTIDESILDELEEVLFTSDLGVKTATDLLDGLRGTVTRKEATDAAALQRVLKEQIRSRLGDRPAPLTFANGPAHPYVVMVVGVNGVGKTTTIGKLAKQIAEGLYGGPSRKVLLGAGDTFRAAAAEQLEIWGQRVGVEVVSAKDGTAPSAVAFDSAKAAVARGMEVLILDTAGRLHTKENLMEELKKVKRILAREIPNAPHEVLLVVDATTGQNALQQAKTFHEGVGITGIVLTKLDGTAKGGIVVAIHDELKIPIRYIGIGEAAEDLRPFDPDAFVDALFS